MLSTLPQICAKQNVTPAEPFAAAEYGRLRAASPCDTEPDTDTDVQATAESAENRGAANKDGFWLKCSAAFCQKRRRVEPSHYELHRQSKTWTCGTEGSPLSNALRPCEVVGDWAGDDSGSEISPPLSNDRPGVDAEVS